VEGRKSGGAEAPWIECAESDLAVDAERSTTSADQDASDADQTASDADQTAAERDEADAISDQIVADLDQARADLGLPPDSLEDERGRDASRRAREMTRVSRLATHGTRVATARSRLGAASGRDDTAAARDATARRRDLRAQAIEQAIATSDAPLAEKLERLRVQAAGDLLYLSTNLFASAQDPGGLEAFHMTAGRRDPRGGLLGPLHASAFAVGEVLSPGLNLMAAPVSGTGEGEKVSRSGL